MQVAVGEIHNGKVTGITKFGAFVEIHEGITGMVHISEISNSYVKEVTDVLEAGQNVKVRIINVNDGGKISLSIKKVQTDTPKAKIPEKELTFEEMMHKYKISSEEKISMLKRNTESKRGASRRK